MPIRTTAESAANTAMQLPENAMKLLVASLVQLVQREAEMCAAERVRQHEIGTRSDVGAVHSLDEVGLLDVPALGRITCGEAPVEELGPHAAIADDDVLGTEKLGDCVHDTLSRQTAGCVK